MNKISQLVTDCNPSGFYTTYMYGGLSVASMANQVNLSACLINIVGFSLPVPINLISAVYPNGCGNYM